VLKLLGVGKYRVFGKWRQTLIFEQLFKKWTNQAKISHICFPEDTNVFEILKFEIGYGVAEIWSKMKRYPFDTMVKKTDPFSFCYISTKTIQIKVKL
jgi:hypothetical protein